MGDGGLVRQGRPRGSVDQGGRPRGNAFTTGVQTFASVGMAADGDFVVAWESEGSGGDDTSGYSIQRSPLIFTEWLIFTDGFESGDTTAWSTTMP